MFTEPFGAYFQHFQDTAEYIPEDPKAADAWVAAGGLPTELLGYFNQDIVISDDGQRDAQVTRIEFQVQTSLLAGITLKRGHTLRINGSVYRIRNYPDHSGITHIALGSAR